MGQQGTKGSKKQGRVSWSLHSEICPCIAHADSNSALPSSLGREQPSDGSGNEKEEEAQLDDLNRLISAVNNHDARIRRLERLGTKTVPIPALWRPPSVDSDNSSSTFGLPRTLSPAADPGSVMPARQGARLGSVKGDDPYSNMWAKAAFNKDRIFDQDLLRSIYDRPHRKMRNQLSLVISGVFGLLSIPFGPIGMVIFAAIGAFFGAITGLLMDIRYAKTSVQESELVKKRLRCLVRWASERQGEDEEMQRLIEMVTLEFRPIAAVADVSRSSQKMLRLLDQWIAQKHIVRKLWIYLDDVLRKWRELERDELLRSMLVFSTLITTYRLSNRISKDEQEIQFIRRVEQVLSHESVKHILAELQNNPHQDDQRVMEVMVFADAAGGKLPPPDQPLISTQNAGQPEELSDDDGTSEVSHPGSRACGSDCSRSIFPSAPVLILDGQSTDKGSPEETPAAPTAAATTTMQRRVLKKPFFKDWNDFMDFDDAIKHKMPITLSEFELLLEKERETKDGAGWDLCVDRKDIKVSKIMYGPGLICLRAWATFPGVDMNTTFHMFYEVEERGKWDKNFNNCRVVAKDVQGCDLVYCLMKIPTVTPRDFLQYRRVRLNDDGSICIVLRSAEHPNAPEDHRYIRVDNKISGYVFRESYVKGQPVMQLFLMSCSDVKGMIPKWIINMLAPKKPGEWTESLRKAALEHQTLYPNRREEVAARLRGEFAEENPYDYEIETVQIESDERPLERRESPRSKGLVRLHE